MDSKKISKTTNFLKKQLGSTKAKTLLILGSGLGDFPNSLKIIKKIPYKLIPGFPLSDVKGHKNQLLVANHNGIEILIMQGRFHYYEGYQMKDIIFPIIALWSLGIEQMIVTNAAGSLKIKNKVGSLMIISDHINRMGENPLRGQKIQTMFPDMSNVYNKGLSKKLEDILKENKVSFCKGTYLAVSGPSYETPAEIKEFQSIGASAVGMSTVPEATIANALGIKVVGISCLTNYGAGMTSKHLDHSEVVAVGKTVSKNFEKVVKELIIRIS